jgi:hypothetical protein
MSKTVDLLLVGEAAISRHKVAAHKLLEELVILLKALPEHLVEALLTTRSKVASPSAATGSSSGKGRKRKCETAPALASVSVAQKRQKPTPATPPASRGKGDPASSVKHRNRASNGGPTPLRSKKAKRDARKHEADVPRKKRRVTMMWSVKDGAEAEYEGVLMQRNDTDET